LPERRVKDVSNFHPTSSASKLPVIAGRLGRAAVRALAAMQLAAMLAAALTLSGCFVLKPPCELPVEQDFYRTVALTTPIQEDPGPPGMLPLSTAPPLVVDEKNPPPAWEMTLSEAVQLGLENS
jgi:hypothetical protein